MIERATSILADLVAFPSVSTESNLPILEYCEDYLTGYGAQCERQFDATGEKANLWATFGPQEDGGFILSAHTDVVPVKGQKWTTDPFTMTERDGRLCGRGTCDMKGFIACILAVAPDIAASGKTVHVALTYDEEVSCLGAVELATHLAQTERRPAMALIGEPTEMRVVDGHKGCWEYSSIITGVEGHGSRPDLGVNAASIAARYAARLMKLSRKLAARPHPQSGFVPPWTTVNIGRIVAGHATNVIPGEARIDWEMRPVEEADGRQLLAALDTFAEDVLLPEMHAVEPTTVLERHTIGEFPAFLPAHDNAARDLLLSLTGQNAAEKVSYCTEAGAFAATGADAVICGPGSILQAHKPDEYVEIAQLSACVDLLRRLIERL